MTRFWTTWYTICLGCWYCPILFTKWSLFVMFTLNCFTNRHQTKQFWWAISMRLASYSLPRTLTLGISFIGCSTRYLRIKIQRTRLFGSLTNSLPICICRNQCFWKIFLTLNKTKKSATLKIRTCSVEKGISNLLFVSIWHDTWTCCFSERMVLPCLPTIPQSESVLSTLLLNSLNRHCFLNCTLLCAWRQHTWSWLWRLLCFYWPRISIATV